MKACVIISGRMGKVLVPRVNHMENLYGIIVFCNVLEYHKSWSSKYAKVKKVVNKAGFALEESGKILVEAYKNKS